MPHPDAKTITYTGPTILPFSVRPPMDVVELHAEGSFNSSAGGIVDTHVSTTTVRTVANDFSEWASVYSEYRTLSIRLEFYSNTPGGPASGLAYAPVYTVITRDSLSTIANYANVVNNSSLRVYGLTQNWVRSAKMDSTEEASFTTVTADPAIGESYQIKYFATGLTATTSYGRFIYRYIVQFRTRQ